MKTKKCCICKRTLGINHFHNRIASKDGKQQICKDCKKLNNDLRRQLKWNKVNTTIRKWHRKKNKKLAMSIKD